MITRNFVTIGREDLPDPDGLIFRVTPMSAAARRQLFLDIDTMIGYAGIRWKFRPLPRKVRVDYLNAYISTLNGFEGTQKRACCIGGKTVATDYLRVVLGDYGAYVEFDEGMLTIRESMTLKEKQEWRNDPEYLEKRCLTKKVKYVWYVWRTGPEKFQREIKVYRQLNPVKYADYLPGKFYISVHEFDMLAEDPR